MADTTLLEVVKAYLAESDPDHSWPEGQVTSAFNAERAAQAHACVVPPVTVPEEEWPADLVSALGRRVQHNLALQALPLGLQTAMGEAGVAMRNVGGKDAEVERLEGPYRRVVFG